MDRRILAVFAALVLPVCRICTGAKRAYSILCSFLDRRFGR
jgi:hypothetical protein